MYEGKNRGLQSFATAHWRRLALAASVFFIFVGACGGPDNKERTPVTWNVRQDGRGDFNSVKDCVAQAYSSDTCMVYPGIYDGTIELGAKSLALRSIGGAGVTVLDAKGAGPVITVLGQEEGSAVIDGFTVTGGYAPQGGGFYIQGASPVIENCIITGNTAQSDGGGIFCFSSDSNPVIRHTIISHNKVGTLGQDVIARGGALCALYGSPLLFNCLLYANSAHKGLQGGQGGALFAGYGATLFLQSSTVAENEAEQGSGGAIFVAEGSAVVENSILWGNTATAGPVGYLDRDRGRDRSATMLLDHVDLDEGSALETLVDTASSEGCRADPTRCVLTARSVLQANPLFVPQGSFYLSHKGVEQQSADSPCINAGNISPQEIGLAALTTCTCATPDSDEIVDLGYHYPIGD